MVELLIMSVESDVFSYITKTDRRLLELHEDFHNILTSTSERLTNIVGNAALHLRKSTFEKIWTNLNQYAQSLTLSNISDDNLHKTAYNIASTLSDVIKHINAAVMRIMTSVPPFFTITCGSTDETVMVVTAAVESIRETMFAVLKELSSDGDFSPLVWETSISSALKHLAVLRLRLLVDSDDSINITEIFLCGLYSTLVSYLFNINLTVAEEISALWQHAVSTFTIPVAVSKTLLQKVFEGLQVIVVETELAKPETLKVMVT